MLSIAALSDSWLSHSCWWCVLPVSPGDACKAPWSDQGAAGKQYQGPVPSPAASSPQRPHWSGLYLFIPLLKSRHERQSCLCVFIMTCVHNRNLEEDSPRESKYGWAFDAGYNWSQMPASAVTVSSLIQLAFRHDVAWPQPRYSTARSSPSSFLPLRLQVGVLSSHYLKVTNVSAVVAQSTSALTLKTWPYPMQSPVGNGKASRLQPIRERD